MLEVAGCIGSWSWQELCLTVPRVFFGVAVLPQLRSGACRGLVRPQRGWCGSNCGSSDRPLQPDSSIQTRPVLWGDHVR
jgi:hypothetical protein